MRHLIDINDLSTEEIGELISVSLDIMEKPDNYRDLCKHKKLAALFYEPSTRTRLSFEAAMLDLGGTVLGFSSADSSSASKGETVADTIRVISAYADIAVIRHPKEGSAMRAGQFSSIPVINAGDGGHQHPTQTLTDLLTIQAVKGKLSGLKVGVCGDLKFGRTVHSLVECLSGYEDNEFTFISPTELTIPEYLKDDVLLRKNVKFTETQNLVDSISSLDILYMTRVQKERFFNEEEYIRLKDLYILDGEKLAGAKKSLAVLHPLPRVNEIDVSVDTDSRAMYFKQAAMGKFIRMALILKLLEAAA